MNIKKIKFFAFDYNKKLGEGATGTVYLGTDLRNNAPIAVKAIDMKNIDNQVTQYLLKNQINALKTTNHPNVLKAIDVIQQPDFAYIVTDYLPNGTLAEYIQKKGFIAEQEALQLFKQIVDGYDHIFDLHIYHRDLKPHNILFDASWRPVLSDFGYCQMTGYLPKPKLQYNVGSPGFMAPESIVGNMYSENSQVWSLATILYEMMTGKNYTNGKAVMEAVMMIKRQGPYYPDSSSPFTKKLLKDCMMLKPEERMKVKTLKKILHDYVKPKSVLPQQSLAMNGGQTRQSMIPNHQQTVLPNQNMLPNVNQNGLLKNSIQGPQMQQQAQLQNNNIQIPQNIPSNPTSNSSNIYTNGPPNVPTNLQTPVEQNFAAQNNLQKINNPQTNFVAPNLQGNSNMLKNNAGFNELLSTVNQQTNSMMGPQFPKATISQPNQHSQSITDLTMPNNTFNQQNANNIIKNLSPRKRGRQSLQDTNRNLKTQESDKLEITATHNIPSKPSISLQQSVQNLNLIVPQKNFNQNVIPVSQTSISKEPLKTIQQGSSQQTLLSNQVQPKHLSVIPQIAHPSNAKVSIDNPFINKNPLQNKSLNHLQSLPTPQTQQFQQTLQQMQQQIPIPPQIQQQTPQQPQLAQKQLQTVQQQQTPLIPSITSIPQISKTDSNLAQNVIINSKRSRRSSRKNLNESGYESQPDTAPFYLPNMYDEEFNYGFIISNGISNNLLGRETLNSIPIKPSTEQSVSSRQSIGKQTLSPVFDHMEVKPNVMNSSKIQNQVKLIQHQQLLVEQQNTQQTLQRQLQQQQRLFRQQQISKSNQKILQLEKNQFIQPIVNQPLQNIANPLTQSFQIPQINYLSNPAQQPQQLRNSQQLTNDFKMRTSFAQPIMHHPVPQFNSQYSNVILPNYFGYAVGP